MPDVMNDDDLDALAAEYVLGTLDLDERSRAQVLLAVDQGFAANIRVW
jgi:anti-sigma-K factor RskA